MERPGRSSNRPFWVKRYSDYRATRMPVIEVSGTSARAGVDHGQDAHAATVDVHSNVRVNQLLGHFVDGEHAWGSYGR